MFINAYDDFCKTCVPADLAEKMKPTKDDSNAAKTRMGGSSAQKGANPSSTLGRESSIFTRSIWRWWCTGVWKILGLASKFTEKSDESDAKSTVALSSALARTVFMWRGNLVGFGKMQ